MKTKNALQAIGYFLKNAGAEIVLFVIYTAMRIVYAPIVWEPVPRYSDWKVCTRPDYQTRDIKRFVVLSVYAGLIYGCSFFFTWWYFLVGLAAVNAVAIVVHLIRKRAKR